MSVRKTEIYPVAVAATLLATDLDVRNVERIAIEVPAAAEGTSIAIEGRLDSTGSYFPVHDAAGAAQVVVVAASRIAIIEKAKWGACTQIRLVINAAQAGATANFRITQEYL